MHDRKGLSSRCPARRPLLTGGSLMRSDSFHNRHQWPLKPSLISQGAPNLTVPRVVPLLLHHVSAVLDAVFGRSHRLCSFPILRLSLRPAEVRPFPRSSATFLGHVMHPHSTRLLRGLMSLRRRSHGPANVIPPVWLCHCGPERTLSESVHCLRPVGRRFTPVPTTKSRLRPHCSQTQTPVHPQYCTKGAEKKSVHGPPHPCAEPRGNGPWRPAFVRRAMRGLISSFICSHFLATAANRRLAANRREVNELALRSNLRSVGRLLPLATAPLLPALAAIPSSGTALSQKPFGGRIVLGEGFRMTLFNEES